MGEKAGAPALLALEGRKGRRCLVLRGQGTNQVAAALLRRKEKEGRRAYLAYGRRRSDSRARPTRSGARRAGSRGAPSSLWATRARGRVSPTVWRAAQKGPGLAAADLRKEQWTGGRGLAEERWTGGSRARGRGRERKIPSLLARATPATRWGESHFTCIHDSRRSGDAGKRKISRPFGWNCGLFPSTIGL